jgi:hypothetical protein
MPPKVMRSSVSVFHIRFVKNCCLNKVKQPHSVAFLQTMAKARRSRYRWDRIGLVMGTLLSGGFALVAWIIPAEEPCVVVRAVAAAPVVAPAPVEPVRERSAEEVKPCACNRHTIPVERNPYTAHREAARALPNSFFIRNDRDAEGGQRKGKLVPVADGPGYDIADLRDSHPLLVPEARDVLQEIGAAFAARLEGTPNAGTLIRVTSLTRTDAQQRGLGRKNYNAIDGGSTHSYGASFDLAFMDRPDNGADCSAPTAALIEVLDGLIKERRILVIPEGVCLHVTVRR